MELIRHPIPIDAVRADTGPVLAGQKVAPVMSRCRPATPGAHAAAHRGFERHLDAREWNLLAAGRLDQRLEHRGGPAREEVQTPTLTLPRKRGRGKGQDRPAMACAAIIRGHSNVRSVEPVRRQKLCCRTGPLEHRDLPSARQQRLDDSREHRDAKAAGDADRRPHTVKLEAASKRAQQVQLVTLTTDGQPGAAGTYHIEDEPDPPARRVGPGSAVRPAQDGVRRAYRQLEELSGADRDRGWRMVEHQLNRPGHRDRALDHESRRERDAHARTTSAATAPPTYSPSVATLAR